MKISLGSMRTWLGVAFSACVLSAAPAASAGDFNALGDFLPDAGAVFVQRFDDGFDPAKDLYVPDDTPGPCLNPGSELIASDQALVGGHYLHVNPNINDGCAERILLPLPKTQSSYTARLWMRHGAVDAQLTVNYPAGSGLSTLVVDLAPTGRVTSDGWVELASNALPVNGPMAERVYLRVFDFDSDGSDIDAIEIFADDAPFWPQQDCKGLSDPVCGEGAYCVHNRCELSRLRVPTLPEDKLRGRMVDMMQSQLRVFFGGQKTRLLDLPKALAKLDEIRYAKDAATFWNGWGTAVRLLHDWHTRADRGGSGNSRRARLNLCFFEGDGDASEGAWPKHPKYRDILVSHVGGGGTHGIAQGDRLVAVDGKHPTEWALSLQAVNWGFWQANDDNVYSELAENMRGLILAYATSFSVIHCDSGTGGCDAVPETYLTADLPISDGGQVRCDNRPFYHFAQNQNPSGNHNVGGNFFKGKVVDAPDADEIYGLLWDTLYGGGDPDGFVNSSIKNAYAEFKQNARGVILDHRAGNGGTLDAAETVTTLVRPVETALIFHSPIQTAGFNGPETPAAGIALFDAFKFSSGMVVGANDYDPDMPVALVLHRDGSASDYMPFGMKGAAKVKLFGPSATAGAFSTFYELSYWGGISIRLASGDAISKDGFALIGHGVAPDFVVLPRQSDLLAGRDTIFEAALAWVQTELKP